MKAQTSCPALQSYFSTLTSERKQQLGRIKNVNLMVVVDNAHIPLGEDFHSRNVEDDDNMEKLSQSLSAMDTLSFPPPFLLDDGSCSSRWDSIEGRVGMCNEFDSALRKPSRSRDDSFFGQDAGLLSECIDRTFHQRQISPVPKKRTRRLLKNYPGGDAFRSYSSPHPSFSLDSTTRWLRELPSLRVGDSSSRGLHRRLEISDDASATTSAPEKVPKDRPPNTSSCRSPHIREMICWCDVSDKVVDLDPAAEEDMGGMECRNKSSNVNMKLSIVQPEASQRKLASHEAQDQVYLRMYSSKRIPPTSVLDHIPLSSSRVP